MKYEERLELLVEALSNSQLNNEEFNMIYGVLELSRDRCLFNAQRNAKIKELLERGVYHCESKS